MVLLKLYLETYYILKSLAHLLTFPLHLLSFCIRYICGKVWVSILSVGVIQRLASPRFGTNLFSRFGRIVLTNTNVHVFFGGSLTGIAILFLMYQPMLQQFDGKYYVVFQQGIESAQAEELPSPTASSSATVIETSMPIVTTVTATPPPVVAVVPKRVVTPFVQPQELPAGYVPPEVTATGWSMPLKSIKYVSTWYRGGHPGVDLVIDYGTSIYPVADGYVERVGSTIWAYGNVVYINHGNGVVSLYAHMSRVDVKPGQKVTKDTVLGAVGSTGNSSGPHLHLELHRNGVPFNPKGVLAGL